MLFKVLSKQNKVRLTFYKEKKNGTSSLYSKLNFSHAMLQNKQSNLWIIKLKNIAAHSAIYKKKMGHENITTSILTILNLLPD